MLPRLSLVYFLLAGLLAAAEPELDTRPVRRWLATQDSIRSLSADFVQTRAFHALRDPVTAKGKFWFVAPVSFRFDIGEPPKMISLRTKDEILLVQPQKKRVQRYAVAELQQQANPALFKFPIAKDFADFNRQFELREVRVEGTHCHIEVAPRDALTRKLLTYARFEFDTESGNLYSAEMKFKDGTSMRNEFSNVQINPKVDRALFSYDVTGYEVASGRE